MSCHKKKIDKIVRRYFFFNKRSSDNKYEFFYHAYLCRLFSRTEYMKDWENFWEEINTRNYAYMCTYFHNCSDLEEAALLRLLVIEDFKNYVAIKHKRR